MLAIEAVGLRKTYASFLGRRPQIALAGLDVAVPRGTAFGLIGLNGAGKTTFIKTILGVVRPSSGSVRVLGGAPEDRDVRAQIGYLPERLHLPNAWAPTAFLASVARLKRIRDPEGEITRQLGRVGLAGDAERKIGGFSKGMRQRLGLAAALLGGPELLVLDEPTDGIDPLGRAEIRRILSEERARGATLFLNSHLLSETERVCDRIGILSKGALIREGALDVLCGSETRFRVRFAPGFDEGALSRSGLSKGEGEGVFLCEAADPRELNAALDRARSSGALLIELQRDMRDLEDVLAEALGSSAGVGAPGEASS